MAKKKNHHRGTLKSGNTPSSQEKRSPDRKGQGQSSGPDPAARISKAHAQADLDIANDPEFSAYSPNDDLDEGETARLGEEKTDLI